jgi:lipopolysaccharide/colanic/teichoic acid biosynthesis glycosyltransferase
MKRRTEQVGRIVAGIALAILAPVFAAIASAIKLEGLVRPGSRGPVFFVEARMSRGRRFGLIKFRTLDRAALDSLGPGPTHIKHLELAGDEHMTRVGRFLKRYYLDELPQLFNIVRGDMALIGTRPWPIELYEEEISTGVTRKRDMPAGLLGPVQAHKGDENSPHGRRLDADYFEAYKSLTFRKLLALDARIALRCIKVMLEGKGL